MLDSKMTLSEVINFKPSDMDMASLPLDIVVYLKVSIVSLYKEDNYNFIQYLFTIEDLKDYFKDIEDTLFIDYDGTNTNKERYVTVFEMYSLYNYENISNYLVEQLQGYSHEADVIIDLFTHDDKQYRLSNLDGIVKLEQLHNENAA